MVLTKMLYNYIANYHYYKKYSHIYLPHFNIVYEFLNTVTIYYF